MMHPNRNFLGCESIFLGVNGRKYAFLRRRRSLGAFAMPPRVPPLARKCRRLPRACCRAKAPRRSPAVAGAPFHRAGAGARRGSRRIRLGQTAAGHRVGTAASASTLGHAAARRRSARVAASRRATHAACRSRGARRACARRRSDSRAFEGAARVLCAKCDGLVTIARNRAKRRDFSCIRATRW